MTSSQTDLLDLPGNGVWVLGRLFNSEMSIVFTLFATCHDCVSFRTLKYNIPLHVNDCMLSCLIKF